LTSVLILNSIVSCSSLESSPKASSSIPENEPKSEIQDPPIRFDRQKAFYPLRKKDGKIVPSYSDEICVKKVLGICVKKEIQIIYLDGAMDWFYANEFGLSKRRD
jgi:hypothetical protein